jgi:hypothetical protein
VEGVDHEGPDPLARLRAAAAAVADLDAPDEGAAQDAGFDVTEHADRFSELHDALVTVLADVDRG